MKASVWIKNLLFKNGLSVDLEADSIVVFVGPNNAGKSRILQEIYQFTKSPQNADNAILAGVNIENQGDEKALLNRLENRHKADQYYYTNDQGQARGFNTDQVKQYWKAYSTTQYGVGYPVNSFFVKQFSTMNRLSLVTPPDNLDFMNQAPSHPIHFLKEDEAMEKEFSKYFKLAFGEDVIVNHGAGSNIPLHVGTRPETSIVKDRVSKEYQTELRLLGMLQNQGDGMKSFAGVFLGLMVEDFSINIIDEPEAFLHPPQARLLGQMIAKNLKDDKQIFLATHSEHLLKGLLDHSDKRLIVIRLQREKEMTKSNLLQNIDIQDIWSDPLLRHSNVLDGLFHSKVILCESDGDCRFFSALSTAICEKEDRVFPDTLYIESGGKARFPVVVKALNKLEIPLTVIGDFDLYNNELPIKSIYFELGGDWDDIKDDFKLVKKAIDQKKPEIEVNNLKTSIDSIFDNIKGNIMPEDKIKLIQKELRKSSAWTQAKSTGKHYLPAGDAMNAFIRVQNKLKEKGIQILEIGEMEAFDKTVVGHGPKWVNEVLAKDFSNATELEYARMFVKNAILT